MTTVLEIVREVQMPAKERKVAAYAEYEREEAALRERIEARFRVAFVWEGDGYSVEAKR